MADPEAPVEDNGNETHRVEGGGGQSTLSLEKSESAGNTYDILRVEHPEDERKEEGGEGNNKEGGEHENEEDDDEIG